MDYKAQNKLIEVIQDLVDATKEQTTEIKKIRIYFKLNQTTPHVKEYETETKLTGSKDEVVTKSESDTNDWGAWEISWDESTWETSDEQRWADGKESIPTTGESGDLKVDADEWSD